MNEILMHALSVSAAATGALVSAIWQGALLATLVFAVLRMFPRLSAAARSVIWLNVFILLALLHVLPALSANTIPARAGAVEALRIDPRWSLVVAALWITLSLARVVQLISGAVYLRRVARSGEPVAVSPALEPLLVHHRHSVQLCASADVARHPVAGGRRRQHAGHRGGPASGGSAIRGRPDRAHGGKAGCPGNHDRAWRRLRLADRSQPPALKKSPYRRSP